MSAKFNGMKIVNGVYSSNHLPMIEASANVIKLYDYKSVWTQQIALCMNDINVTYFNNTKAEYIPNDIKTFIGNQNMTTITYRIQTYDLLMCGHFCTRFVDFMFKDESLTGFTA